MIWAEFILGFSVIAFAFAVLTIFDMILGHRQRRRDLAQRQTDARILEAYERDMQSEAEGRDEP